MGTLVLKLWPRRAVSMNGEPSAGRVAQLVRALVSHTRGPGFESLRDHTMHHSTRQSPEVELGAFLFSLPIRVSTALAGVFALGAKK